jgi:hypothetical protein
MATTTGSRLLIQASITLLTGTPGPNVWCQPNIDDSWAGSSLVPAVQGPVLYDSVTQLAVVGASTATISRVYPAPVPGNHTFTLACATTARGVTLPLNSTISYSVFELR